MSAVVGPARGGAGAGAVPPAPAGSAALCKFVADSVFKRIFTDPAALIKLLNALALPLASPIEELSYVDTEQVAETPIGRLVIFDIHCKLGNGDLVIIELQKKLMRDVIMPRVVGYAARAFIGQWLTGGKQNGYHLVPVHAVALIDFKLEERGGVEGDLVQRWALGPLEGCIPSPTASAQLQSLLSVTVVQLPLAAEKPSDSSTDAYKWAHLIHSAHEYTLDDLPAPLRTAPFMGVARKLALANMSSAQLDEYWGDMDKMNADEAHFRALTDAEAARTAAEAARTAAEAALAAEVEGRTAAEAALAAAKAARAAAQERIAELVERLKAAGISPEA